MLTDSLEPKETLDQDQQSIKKLIEETCPSSVKASDGKGYASMFAPDALWMPPGSPDFRGGGRQLKMKSSVGLSCLE